MTATATGKRDIAELPHNPDHIQLEYRLEASLGNHEHEDTLEKWSLTAHLGEDFGMDHIPPCDACLARWHAAEEADSLVRYGAEALAEVAGRLEVYVVASTDFARVAPADRRVLDQAGAAFSMCDEDS